MHEENSPTETKWKTIVIIKDLLLLNSELLLDF